MAKTLVMSNSVTDAYKSTTDALKKVELSNNNVIRKSLVQIMKQSFFHGASIYGTTNFIA